MSMSGREGKFNCMLRSRSHRVGQDLPAPASHILKQSCWANMLPELLRDVLMRIESSETSWPQRKNVVACAGVCRNWREIMKEIVKNPEISGKLTFPISVKQPGHRTWFMQCYIKRNRSGQMYHLLLSNQALNENGKFLLAARRCRRPTYTDYVIYANPDDSLKGNSVIGKLRSNFLGTKFTIFDAQPPNTEPKITKCRSTRLVGRRHGTTRAFSGNHPVAHVSYELNVLGSRGPRRMQCIMGSIPASAAEPGGTAPTQTAFMLSNDDSFPSLRFFRSKSTREENSRCGNMGGDRGDGRLVLKNKSPRWHEQLQCWCLNFNGRVTVASVKNFQLVALNGEQENVLVQFGKVGKDVFTMDYRYPISAFQAFAICLSSFDTKIACE